MIENNSFQRQSVGFHVFCGQYYAVDGAKSGICYENTGKMELFHHIFQLNSRLVKADGAENATASFYRYIVVDCCYICKSMRYYIHHHRISLQTGCQVRRISMLIDIGTHGSKRLIDAAHGLNCQGVSRD